jgi:hypothetical protein
VNEKILHFIVSCEKFHWPKGEGKVERRTRDLEKIIGGL